MLRRVSAKNFIINNQRKKFCDHEEKRNGKWIADKCTDPKGKALFGFVFMVSCI